MSMTPIARYQADLQRQEFVEDAAQREAIEALQWLYERLVADYSEQQQSFTVSWLGSFAQKLKTKSEPSIKGLYFWGGVGRGKTYLMDLFYESLPFEQKKRMHFHHFMRHVHREFTVLRGTQDPLVEIAKRLAKEARVLCFDEFFVTDITDAMILGGLLEQLFKRGVTLVATSNIAPQGLYENGLQRNRFLPAIALLEQYTQVMNVDGGIDYRLRALTQADVYYCCVESKWADPKSLTDELERRLKSLVSPEYDIHKQQSLTIEGRELMSQACAEDVAWFEFSQLCDSPRSQNDYIELARLFHAVIISGIPVLTADKDDATRRFINLVDEFYDRSVKLILSMDVPLEQLYRGSQLAFPFERTLSRLQEMQSQKYLAKAHRP